MDVSLSVSLSLPVYPPRAQMASLIRASLKVFNKYYRAKVAQRFAAQGPGWPSRAEIGEGAQKAREQQAVALGEHRLAIKLARQHRRALQQFLRGKGTQAASERRAKIVVEHINQMEGRTSTLNAADKADRRLVKSVAGLRERANRASQKAAEQLLGRMGGSMRSRIEGSVLTVRNTMPFSGVQDEGGTVGHGAVIPPRPFNYFDETDRAMLVSIVLSMIGAAGA